MSKLSHLFSTLPLKVLVVLCDCEKMSLKMDSIVTHCVRESDSNQRIDYWIVTVFPIHNKLEV